jgi:flagellar biosynthesis protein FlhG
MFKLVPEFTLEHVVTGEKTLKDITLYKEGVEIIPGYSGLSDFVSLNDNQRQRLLNTLKHLKSKYDYLIIDNPAGINSAVLSYIKLSDNNILIITPEPTSLTDAFSLIRVANKNIGQKLFHVIVNNVKSKNQADAIFKRFSMAVDKYIGSPVNYLGHIAADELMTSSICMQNPVVLQHPTARSCECFEEICRNVISLPAAASKKCTTEQQADATPRIQPDFSTQSEPLSDNPHQDTTERSETTPTLKTLQNEITRVFSDNIYGQADLKEFVRNINTAYSNRFNNTTADLASEIHKAVISAPLTEPSLRNLLMTLHSIYLTQYGQASPSNDSITEQSSGQHFNAHESIDYVIKLLQQENLSHFQKQLNQVSREKHSLKLIPESAKEKTTHHELLDSIRYATMTER